VIICISDILGPDQIDRLVRMMDQQTFIDGRETAGWAATGVKENQQVAGDSADYSAMQAMVTEALAANRFFATAAMPRAMRPILFSRYLPGMSYGLHVDNALMGDAPQTRIDLAFTLFLSNPASYEGGELAIDEHAARGRGHSLPCQHAASGQHGHLRPARRSGRMDTVSRARARQAAHPVRAGKSPDDDVRRDGQDRCLRYAVAQHE
jgi:predicted 2-oxoglutarate/Fe(II)-dependent dioxygenase YbiX